MSHRLSTISASNFAGRAEPARANTPANLGFGRALHYAENEPPAAKPNRQTAFRGPPSQVGPAVAIPAGANVLAVDKAQLAIAPDDAGAKPANTDSLKPDRLLGDDTPPTSDNTSQPFNPKDNIDVPASIGTLLAGAAPSVGLTKPKLLPTANATADQNGRTPRTRGDAEDGAATQPPITPASIAPAPIAPPPEAPPRAEIPPLVLQQFGEKAVPIVNAGSISPELPGAQPDALIQPKNKDGQQATPANQPEIMNLGIETMLAGPTGSLNDRLSAALPDRPVATGLNQAEAPALDAILTTALPPTRKGATPAGAEQNETGASAMSQQVDMSAASGAASHTPAAVTGPIVPPPATLGHGPSTVSIANQILPSVIALTQGHISGDRISISMSPETLGHVSITVDRAMDGTTSIQISAERLATMELLRTDQADLLRALHEAGVSQNSSSLSFSWHGGNGGMQGWAGQGEPQGERRPASAQFYAEEPASIAAVSRAVAHGGVDVTA